MFVAVRTDDELADVYDVFVSYNWHHQRLVVDIVDQLKTAGGFSVWFDLDDMCTSHRPVLMINRQHHLHAVCRCVL